KLVFFISCNILAQEADSVLSYELEPAYISKEKDGLNYTTLNYFSAKYYKYGGRGTYPIGAIGDSSKNFGVKIPFKKNNNTLFIRDAVFLIHEIDTYNIDIAKFYVLVKSVSNQIRKIELNAQKISSTIH